MVRGGCSDSDDAGDCVFVSRTEVWRPGEITTAIANVSWKVHVWEKRHFDLRLRTSINSRLFLQFDSWCPT